MRRLDRNVVHLSEHDLLRVTALDDFLPVGPIDDFTAENNGPLAARKHEEVRKAIVRFRGARGIAALDARAVVAVIPQGARLCQLFGSPDVIRVGAERPWRSSLG